MTLLQAILLGILYWFGKAGVNQRVWTDVAQQPLTCSLFVGLILGDVPTAMIVGATIQPMFLAAINAGWAVANDVGAATILAGSVAIVSGMDAGAAVTVALASSLVFSQISLLRMSAGSIWIHLTDSFIEKRKYNKLFISVHLLPKLFNFVIYGIPMILAVYFGAQSVGILVNGLPAWLQNGLAALGSMMPALGFGVLLASIGKKEYMPFFVIGFFITAYSGLGSVGIVLMALAVAYFDYRWGSKDLKISTQELRSDDMSAFQSSLSKKAYRRTWFRLLYSYTSGNSYERYQANGVAYAMLPALEEIYEGDPEGLHDAVVRSAEMMNAEDATVNLPVGVLLAMEEQKAKGAPVLGESITEMRAALYPPMAAVGDTLNPGTIRPIVLALLAPYALTGAAWPAVVAALLWLAIFDAEAWWLMGFGFKQGASAIQKLMSSGIINKVLSIVSVMGLFVIGGMSFASINVTTPLAIVTQYGEFAIQSGILDALVPGLLSFITVMLVGAYLKKEKSSVIKAVLILAAIALICGSLGILA